MTAPAPRWTNDILPGLIDDQVRRDSAREAAYSRPPAYEPGHNYGDRNVWRRVGGLDDPWGCELVNRDGYTPNGRCLFPKEKKA